MIQTILLGVRMPMSTFTIGTDDICDIYQLGLATDGLIPAPEAVWV